MCVYCREDAEWVAAQATKVVCLEHAAQLLGIAAALLVGFSILLSWASGAMSNDGSDLHNSSTAVIAGIGCLIGLGIAVRAWNYHKTSRRVALYADRNLRTPTRG